MSRMIEIFVTCVILVYLVSTSVAAPWSQDNELREFDLEWQCDQLCNRLFGRPEYNSTTSKCSCYVDKENEEMDWQRIKQNAKYLGLFLDIINRNNSKAVLKRETGVEKIKKLIATKKAVETNDGGDTKKDNVTPNQESTKKETSTTSERPGKLNPLKLKLPLRIKQDQNTRDVDNSETKKQDSKEKKYKLHLKYLEKKREKESQGAVKNNEVEKEVKVGESANQERNLGYVLKSAHIKHASPQERREIVRAYMKQRLEALKAKHRGITHNENPKEKNVEPSADVPTKLA